MATSTADVEFIEHKVTHFRQRYNWDCGVACVLMLLSPEQREEALRNFHQICQEEGFRQSTWTIDLAYLLKRFGIEHTMYTTTLGVNENHKRHSYYHKIIDEDRERVQRRFAAAARCGLRVQRGCLPPAALRRHAARAPAILLVDAGLLACDLCKHNKLRADFRRWFGGSYSGHFVLVTGVWRRRVLFRDPALPARLCAAPLPRLQAARAPPTDHDVILIHPAPHYTHPTPHNTHPTPHNTHPTPHNTHPATHNTHTTHPTLHNSPRNRQYTLTTDV